MHQEPLDFQSMPLHEIRVFMQSQAQHILLAEFYSARRYPEVGETLSIELFKDDPQYPNLVRILGIKEHFDVGELQTAPYKVFSITAEPVM